MTTTITFLISNSPRTFARELASIAAEHLGQTGQVTSLSHSFEGLPTLSTDHPVQLIYHGPVIYVDDVYGLSEAATSNAEFMLLPLFAKDKIYAAQREYRFVIVTETEPAKLFEDLPISPGMSHIIGEGKSDVPPQWTPNLEVTARELAPAERASINSKADNLELDEVAKESLGRRLLNDNSLETELFRTFTRAKDPATVHRPREINADDLPDDFRAMTGIYTALSATW